LLKYTSTGNILPGIFNLGAPLKYYWNLAASRVADITINFKSDLFAIIYFTNPNKISVFKVLSWASSNIMTEYL